MPASALSVTRNYGVIRFAGQSLTLMAVLKWKACSDTAAHPFTAVLFHGLSILVCEVIPLLLCIANPDYMSKLHHTVRIQDLDVPYIDF